MDVGCDNWMSHTHMRSFIWRTMHINDSWHTYEWVMAYIWMSHGRIWRDTTTYQSVTHIWGCSYERQYRSICHGIHMNESWHTYEWVMAYIWMSHAYIWMSHARTMWNIWISHTHMRSYISCHTCEWVMHIWGHTYEWVMHVWHQTYQ